MNRVRQGLAVAFALLASSLCSGCFLWQGSYKMDIVPAGVVIPQLKQLNIIVAEDIRVSEALRDEATYEDLLDEQAIRGYASFVVYKPVPEGWELVNEQSTNKRIKYRVKRDAIKIQFPHSIIKKSGMTQYTIVVLALYADGYRLKEVRHADLDAKLKHVLNVTSVDLALREK